MTEVDSDTILLRLLCERAEDRLERVWTAAELAARRLQLRGGRALGNRTDLPSNTTEAGIHYSGVCNIRWSGGSRPKP